MGTPNNDPRVGYWSGAILNQIQTKLDKVSDDVAEIRAWKDAVDFPKQIDRITSVERQQTKLVHITDLEKTDAKIEKLYNIIRVGGALALGGGFGSGFGIGKYGEEIIRFIMGG